MSGLPQHWRIVRVDEAGSVQLGRQRSPEHHAGPFMRPYLRVANVYENKIDTSDVLEMNFTPQEAERFELKYGDILLNEGQSRELVGRPAMYRDEVPGACFQNTLLRFRAYDHVHPQYALSLFRYYLRSGEFQNVCRWTTNIAHLGAARFAAMPFPLPPLEEQKRIADKLDRLLAAVDSCKARLDAIPAILKRFRQSVLAAATSGKLTEEWRGARGLKLNWINVRLDEISEIQGGITKDSKKQSATDREVPYLRVANVQRGRLDLSEIKTIRVPENRLSSLMLEPGDVLFTEGGDIDKLGRGWIWEGQIENCSYQNHIFRARLFDRRHHPKYVSWWSNYRGLGYFLGMGKQTTNLASINKSQLSALPISLPSSEEQVEIVAEVEDLLSAADQLEARISSARELVFNISQGLLAKAFRGELVPQDPADEHFGVLLQKTKAEYGRYTSSSR